MTTYVVSTINQVALVIVNKLSMMQLSHFPGEDVSLMAATVRADTAHLTSCNHLPRDMNEIVAENLDSASTFKFCSFFDTLLVIQDPVMRDWERMLDRASSLYQDLVLKGRLLPNKKKLSTFVSWNKNGN